MSRSTNLGDGLTALRQQTQEAFDAIAGHDPADISDADLAELESAVTGGAELVHRSERCVDHRDVLVSAIAVTTGAPGVCLPSETGPCWTCIEAEGTPLYAYIVISLLMGALTWDHVDLGGRPDDDPPVPPSI